MQSRRVELSPQFQLSFTCSKSPPGDPTCELFPAGPYYSRYFAGGFSLGRGLNSTRRYSVVPKRELRSQFPLLPLDGSSSTVPSFQLHPVFGSVSNRVPSDDATLRFVIYGNKAGTTSKLFKLKALSFRFAPKGTADAPCKLNSTENARFETRSLLSAQATSCNRSRINAGGLQTVRKTAGHKFQPLIAKGNRVRWLSHEFFHDRHGN